MSTISVDGCVSGITLDAMQALRAKALGQNDFGRGQHVQIHANTLLELLTIAAAVPALQAAAPVWQPIEIAPKDRKLLLGSFNARGNWRTVLGGWITQDEIDEYWENADDFIAGWFEIPVEGDDETSWKTNPTHWMPLPAAPVVTEGCAA